MSTSVRLDPELIRRYDGHGPRYTSYPTALQFREDFQEATYCEAAAAGNAAGTPLSLYVHVPFCTSPCFYCACNRIITRAPEKAAGYLQHLHNEIRLQGALFSRHRQVEQLHFGGGTPTFLTSHQLGGVLEQLGRHFSLSESADREYSIEIDPRTVSARYIDELAGMGFNRMSLGVQDCDPDVQEAVNRVQPTEKILAAMAQARSAGFNSISIDLIYGLPRQTRTSFARTLDTVIAARPDRLAVYGYAHMPQVFKAQRQISNEELPSSAQRLELLQLGVEKLTAAGYVYIAMDHFALPTDELVRAQEQGHLHRNFQGYSTRAHCDIVGLGVSSIGKVADTYAQNEKTLRGYYAALAANRLPLARGLKLDEDDQLRREIIQQIMCHDRVDFRAIEARFEVDLARHCAAEFERLQSLESDGLVKLETDGLAITPAGQLLRRNIAMVFDAYLGRAAPAEPKYSRAI